MTTLPPTFDDSQPVFRAATLEAGVPLDGSVESDTLIGSSDARSSTPPPTLVYAVPVRSAASRDNQLLEGTYRLFEIMVALIGLILGFPIMLIEAAIIKMDSSGPALFSHPRTCVSKKVLGSELKSSLGLHSPDGTFDPDQVYYVPQTFSFIKFRTMYHDAAQRFPERYAYNFPKEEFHKRLFKDPNDPRVTRAGRFLRRTTIDELPNFWSVLVGDMRLVGPRPELPNLLCYYSAEEMYKFSTKPGITGLAQINGRGNLSWGDTIGWDLQYVRTQSVWLDLKILFKTLWLVLVRRGAF